ncbi:MAG TPA: phage tail tape measure protein [Kaistia sp.]|nr:phage tail tape measure protein [Kaistia sp.]
MPTVVDELSVKVSADTSGFRAALDDLAKRADSFSGAIGKAFTGAVTGGKDFEDVLKSLALRLSSIALGAALKPIESGVGGLLSGIVGQAGTTAFAKGGVVPFADGGVVSRPSYFPLGKGLGLAGEAGAEAILPLQRGADGRLGVGAGGGSGNVTVNVAIQTPDAASFRKSEAQVTASLARAVGRGRRGL